MNDQLREIIRQEVASMLLDIHYSVTQVGSYMYAYDVADRVVRAIDTAVATSGERKVEAPIE